MFYKSSKLVILTKNKKEKLIVVCNLEASVVSLSTDMFFASFYHSYAIWQLDNRCFLYYVL